MSLEQINKASEVQAYSIFESCCCAPNWVNQMIKARPFNDAVSLLKVSQNIFLQLTEQDYLKAFTGHPQIGNLATLHKKYANTSSTASHEQSGMSSAEKEVLEEMVELNQIYLQKFGFIFIVCASGKSALQMLELIKSRIGNERLYELKIASDEQVKITTLRLEKLL
ncbi:2-oxo-4-hydroxy-4-carboxy-5-ureidoimidazoline decarboxylase [Psychromonas sp. RZ22]|uniref:2-oxo-4-hydroxy-4-carboxy-5-ureidoimidazoline decarboxylase n=1 Tax=Psychromonas algarum TaxID=2555643 RepID=UPI001068765F|nr:2-oxo-4-hydroxy-4-carboxy-5-ureidoimidazoline decarboxylase [Psychromonas sp. RZ22]TEW53126.1 2-oxo-4-hydroxy-4-carboxy-5-ureidoimidazoline decarboxylase [Psychromonas sp. RZ22]